MTSRQNQNQNDQDVDSPSSPRPHNIELDDSRPGNSDSVDSSEYVMVDDEELTEDHAIEPVPSYQFPRTWGAAVESTSKAMGEIGAASKVFGKAVAKSGITEAGWSVGGFLAASANAGAVTAAGYAVKKSGTDTDRLPGPLRNWLTVKERRDAAKKRAQDQKLKRAGQRMKEEMIARGEVMPVPSRSTSQASFGSSGPLPHMLQPSRRQSMATQPEREDFKLEYASDDDGFKEVDTAPPARNESSPHVGNRRLEAVRSGPQEVVVGEEDEDEDDEEEIGLAGMVGKE
ncbi:hypothetical protein CC80DRAFT_501870 [Byssothecium circinans]|uniref:Uncharacterized protein n=1 Tax=Byssothecium circinans TaxID=147558 RepID=A0A6A5UF02_9PLEO|nr:hypothetical protein CC80DRAFT_501870 [Byssothecium circinans]